MEKKSPDRVTFNSFDGREGKIDVREMKGSQNVRKEMRDPLVPQQGNFLWRGGKRGGSLFDRSRRAKIHKKEVSVWRSMKMGIGNGEGMKEMHSGSSKNTRANLRQGGGHRKEDNSCLCH